MSSVLGGYYKSTTLEKGTIERFNDVLSKAIKLTKEFVSILDLPFKTPLIFSSNCTEFSSEGDDINSNVRKLFIPTDIFNKEAEKTDEELINTTVGLGIHEASHLLYSEVFVYEDYVNKLFADKRVTEVTELGHLKVLMFNIIEDSRVDTLLLKSRPGYKDFINEAKKYRLETAKSGIDKFKKSLGSTYLRLDSKIGIIEILLNVISLINFPDLFKNSLGQHEEFYESIKSMVSKLPARTLDSCTLASDIVNKMSDYINSIDPLCKKTWKDLDSIAHTPKSPLFEAFTSDLIVGNDGTLDKVLNDGFTRSLSKLGLTHDSKISKKVVEGSFRSELEIMLGTKERGTKDDVYFHKTTVGSQSRYLKLKSEIEKFIPQIKKKIIQVERNTPMNVFGCRSGILDTTKLVEAIQGVPQVYYRTCQVKTNKVHVAVLVDESGSMGCYCGGSGIYRMESRSHVAKLAATLLNESLKDIPGVGLYIYGHSADERRGGDTDIRIYREPGYNRPFAIADIDNRCENRDGTAIYEVGKRIRSFTQDPVILFVLSDGVPAARGYWGRPASLDVRDNVDKTEKMGIEVVQITLVKDFPKEEIDIMFKKSIDLSGDLSQLPDKLGSLLKKTILEKKVTTIEYQ